MFKLILLFVFVALMALASADPEPSGILGAGIAVPGIIGAPAIAIAPAHGAILG